MSVDCDVFRTHLNVSKRTTPHSLELSPHPPFTISLVFLSPICITYSIHTLSTHVRFLRCPISDVDGNRSCPRLLLDALRLIRSRQRQGRGEPQPASAAIMEGVWNGRWEPSKSLSGDGAINGDGFSPDGNNRNNSRGDDPRCAVCLEEIRVRGNDSSPGLHEDGRDESGETVEVKADIGSEEAVREQTEDSRSRGRVAYLPCGHRFHTHW